MSNTNYIERLKKIIEEHHTQWGKFLRRDENKDLLDLILSYESDKFKKIQCESKRIRLLTISESDWVNEQDICKSKIVDFR